MSGVGTIDGPADAPEHDGSSPALRTRKARGEQPAKIAVSVSGRNSFVWSAEDALLLRKTHRIVGSLIGSLPRAPQQNIFLSLPLALLPEELYVLITEGLCTLHDDLETHTEPTEADLGEYEATERTWAVDVHKARLDAAKAQRLKHLTVAAKKDGEVETRDVQLEASSSGNVEGNLELSSPANIPVEALPVRLRTSSVPFPWFHAKEARSDIFPFPETDDERNRAQVFYDLWKKGLFLSSGSKFGANYLAYPGDPLRYHSNYTVSVIGKETKVPLMDIVTVGRLGTVVKKNRLLAVAGAGEDGAPRYFSTEWTGWP